MKNKSVWQEVIGRQEKGSARRSLFWVVRPASVLADLAEIMKESEKLAFLSVKQK